ncbi:hypothetical protein BCR43DRAFT_489922, partial [Syncephalastrum racemosum]
MRRHCSSQYYSVRGCCFHFIINIIISRTHRQITMAFGSSYCHVSLVLPLS